IVPVTLAQGDSAAELVRQAPGSVIATVRGDQEGLLVDALAHPPFCSALLQAIAAGRRYFVEQAEVTAAALPTSEPFLKDLSTLPPPSLNRDEQTHTFVTYGDRLILKVFRRIEEGVHPEVEIGRYLTERQGFPHVAPLVGVLERRRRKSEPTVLAVLH